jgi:hypothetical protein
MLSETEIKVFFNPGEEYILPLVMPKHINSKGIRNVWRTSGFKRLLVIKINLSTEIKHLLTS